MTLNSSISGKDLAKGFYIDAVKPIIEQHYPDLNYSAGLLGPGSDVLDFDTRMSTDHNWGPRVVLYLSKADLIRCRDDLDKIFGRLLPFSYQGFSTNYLELEDEPGTDVMKMTDQRPVNHRVSIVNLDEYIHSYLGIRSDKELSLLEWLTIPEQKLRTIVDGAVFYDGLAVLETLIAHVAYYPHDLWLYLLSAQWQRIGQEEPFVGRAGTVGDDLGSSIISTRLVGDLMRLAFLIERKYAPYSKWFGSAFQQLQCADTLSPLLDRLVSAENWQIREENLGKATMILAQMSNDLKINKPLPTSLTQFHDRPFYVIQGEAIGRLIWEAIQDETVKKLPPGVGKIDQITHNIDILSFTERSRSLAALYF
jgi:hypothetical protein